MVSRKRFIKRVEKVMTALIVVATLFLIGAGFLSGVMWLSYMIHTGKLTVELIDREVTK